MSEKKIELIAQLLAKAESTTPEEAEALTEHAERLMVKYAIDQAVIDERRASKGNTSEKIIEERLDFTGAYRGELLHLTASVAYGLGALRGMQFTGGTGKVFSYWIIGFESDVKQARLLVESLQVQAAIAVRAWWKLNKGDFVGRSNYDQEKARRSFVHGFGSGAGNRIRESRNHAVQEAGTGTELVLVSREAKVQAHMDAMSLKRGRGRTATGHDRAALSGFQAGKQANTGERAVSQGKGITA